MAKDVERTCRNCGHRWLLPKRVASERAPNRMEMAGRKMMAGGSSLSPLSVRRGSDQLRLGNAQAKLDRVLANSQCPACGSSKFMQGKPSPRPATSINPTPRPAPPINPTPPQSFQAIWPAIDALLDELRTQGWSMRSRILRKEIAWLREEALKRGHDWGA